MYTSLGEFICRLEREGELLRIKTRVSSDLEIAEITDRMAKTHGGGKALLFENTDREFPVLTNMMGSDRRMAMALGVGSLDETGRRIDMLLQQAGSPKDAFADKLKMLPMLAEMARWFPRKSARRGECQQVILRGEEADISRLPVLKCWGCDGGRFVTLPMVNTVDPDSGIRNVGMYRMQIFDGHTTGMHWHIHKTGARHYEAYKRLGRKMPVAVALGGDPVYTYCATAPMPDNMDEYLLAGFLRRKPVKLVRCITCDIYVPSDCDFVIEGYVDPAEEKTVEGAFGDHTGFYSLTDLYPRFHITAITHRRDAVYPATVVGIPPQEDAYIAKATEKIFLAPIRLAIQPEIEDMTMPVAGTAHNLAVVSLTKRYTGQATKVAQALWGAGQMMFNKYMLLTRSGIDIRDPRTLAAIMRRMDPERNIIRSEGILDVLDHATATCGFGGKAAIDATDIDPQSVVESYKLPDRIAASHGVSHTDTRYAEEWGVVILFATHDAAPKAFIEGNGLDCVNFAVVLDEKAYGLCAADLLWLAAANTDPRRDLYSVGRCMVVDARSKRPGAEGNPARWPNAVTSLPETIDAVDARWDEYGIGEFIESPSRRYRPLLLSDTEKW